MQQMLSLDIMAEHANENIHEVFLNKISPVIVFEDAANQAG